MYISTYNLGKEEILVELAEHFSTKIVVSKERYLDVISMGFSHELFTTREDGGWIFVKSSKSKMNRDTK